MTIRDLALNRREIAEKGGISESSLSRFLAGETDLGASRLESVVNALPEEAKSRFFLLLSPPISTPNVSPSLSLLARLENHLKRCDQQQFMEVLKIVVDARRERLEAN
ncbi:MAG: helix-turn-helix domain-containing protein [Cyanobacteria bacterium P01_H01_bin.153]